MNTVEVTTTAGIVRGVRRPGSTAFLGIPYAAPPVGELRFAAPVPHPAWSGVRDAGSPGATPQRIDGGDSTLVPEPSFPGESTLNLSVFTPDPAPAPAGAGLPVLVYIHGGGYTSGSAASPWYDGASFNRHGVVTVNVSYRLGFDGFGWIEDAPLNRGVLDWLLALAWVRDNIQVFGGDPARVTIAGQSAGGGAVLTLLTMPRAQPLFALAIVISGVATYLVPDQAERTGRRLAALAGVAPTRAGLGALTENQILAEQPRATAFAAGTPAGPLGEIANALVAGLPFGPVVDGDLVPLATVDAVRAGIGAAKPLMLGSTDHEFNFAIADLTDELAGEDAAEVLGRLGVAAPSARAYAAAHDRLGTAELLGQFASDRAIRGVMLRVAEARAEAATTDAAPSWLWAFAWRSPTLGGALHCLDLPFFFDALDAPRVAALAGPAPSQRLADEVHGAAVSFINDGDPGWPAWTPRAWTTEPGDLDAQPVRRFDDAPAPVDINADADAPGTGTGTTTVAATYADARLAFGS
ncbi:MULTISPECIES: carboxylesterase/lipase family protein [Cryobacterium]|uniref:carboxylesterase/lipase family protein n=1 Tax=Cryobacterium TaxID=69578 RepID=UPI000CD3DB26|nr:MULTISPECIES: carboxylesterase family protein [Cryobacterium]POH63554.1 carboxylesterase [Cryobacterium zongtaii]TFC42108.1 carboxylesterase/lipase family protein [Cryobacterium sp. TMN-39-2]